MKFHLKNWKNYLEKISSRSFDEVHCSPFFFIIRLVFIFQDQIFYCTKKVSKNHNKFWYFRHGGETHFLVLAQTLIYACKALMQSAFMSQLSATDWPQTSALSQE